MNTRIRRTLGAATIALAFSLSLVPAAVALATPAAPSITIYPNTVHGCVTGKDRILEHVYTSDIRGLQCPKGSFFVSWPSTR